MKVNAPNLMFLLFSISITTFSYGQVGIGTTSPESALHVAGSTSDVRIDGMSAINNSLNNGTDLEPVYVDQNGELTLTNVPVTTKFLVNTEDMIMNHRVDTSPTGGTNEEELHQTSSFTLTRPAYVAITYGVGIVIEGYQQGSGTIVFDGKPKLYRTFFRLGDGSTASGRSYAKVAATYTNAVDVGVTGITTTGYLYLNGTDYLYLVPGTYSVHLFGRVAANNGGPLGVAADAFTANFGGIGDSYLRVVAHY